MSQHDEQRLADPQPIFGKAITRQIDREGICEVCGSGTVFTVEERYIEGFDKWFAAPNTGPRACSEPCSVEVARRDAEQRKVEAAEAAAADEAIRRVRVANANGAVWPRFRGATIEGLVPELAKLDADASVILTGPTGTGKTFQAWAWWQRWAVGRETTSLSEVPQFYTAPDLLEQIRRSYSGKALVLDSDALLVVDDLGVERPTEWVLEQLYRIVDERYRLRKPLVVTTNLGGGELRDRLGDRVVSRLAEMCCAVRLEGKDKRLGRGAA